MHILVCTKKIETVVWCYRKEEGFSLLHMGVAMILGM